MKRLGGLVRLPGGGLVTLPVPISTPGFDSAPYLTATRCTTADTESGIRNIGTYRAAFKKTDCLRCACHRGSAVPADTKRIQRYARSNSRHSETLLFFGPAISNYPSSPPILIFCFAFGTFVG